MSNWSRRDFLRTGALAAVTLSGGAVTAQEQAAGEQPTDGGAVLSCVTFKLDVTPEIGTTMAYSTHRERKNSIYIRGAVFDDGEKRVVWAACDYLFICGETYIAWREKIAEAAGTQPLNVFLHSIHTHESMWVAPEYNPGPGEDWRKVTDQEYCDKTIAELTALIAEKCAGPWRPIAKLYTAEQRVWGLGACRRVLDENGKLVDIRWSECSNPLMHQLPVGVIDPLLRSVVFEDNAGEKFLAMHFYATHPQTESLRDSVSPDVPGYALRMAEAQFPGMEQVYFNGCGGNVTLGKYNVVDDDEGIAFLGGRLGKYIIANLGALIEREMGKIEVVHATFDVPINEELIKEMPDNRGNRQYVLKTIDLWRQSELSRVSFGPEVHLLSIDFSEVCIEYQLYAQSLIPTLFLGTAAYGNCTMQYIPIAEAYGDGSFESSPGCCMVKPEIEQSLKKAIAEVLADLTER